MRLNDYQQIKEYCLHLRTLSDTSLRRREQYLKKHLARFTLVPGIKYVKISKQSALREIEQVLKDRKNEKYY